MNWSAYRLKQTISGILAAVYIVFLNVFPVAAILDQQTVATTSTNNENYVGASLGLSNYTVFTDHFWDEGMLTLTMTVVNDSPHVAAYNIKVSCNPNEESVLPAYGTTSQFYIPELAAGESVVKTVSFQCQDSSELDRFVATIKFSYSDMSTGSLQRWENSVQIGCHLKQSMDTVELLSIQSTALPDSNGVTPLNISVLNRANFDLTEIEMIVDDMMGGTPQRVQLDPVQSDSRLDTKTSLTLAASRMQEISVFFLYKNADGDVFRSRESTYVVYRYYDPSAAVDSPSPLVNVLHTRRTEIFVYFGLIVLVSGFLVFIKIRKNRVS